MILLQKLRPLKSFYGEILRDRLGRMRMTLEKLKERAKMRRNLIGKNREVEELIRKMTLRDMEKEEKIMMSMN
jgi:hypothetical protein